MAEVHPKVKKLLNIKQPVQRSQEWFKMRENKVTASSAASLLIRDEQTCGEYVKLFNLPQSYMDNKCANPYSSMKDYILTKCGHKKFTGSEATYWGVMLEQVATDIYSRRSGKEVIEFGLLPHPTIDFIAASPDGITPDGIMLEIKCPFKRKITGVVPFYYYTQMQLQLEVANLRRCDYLECEFVELKTRRDYDETKILGDEEKGILIEFRPKHLKDRAESIYEYPKKDEKNLDKWVEKIRRKNKEKPRYAEDKYDLIEVYWKLVVYSVVRVQRDKVWFQNILPILKKGFDEVMYYKENGCDSLIKVKPVLNILTFDDIDAGRGIKPENDIDMDAYQMLDSESD
jgi:putative phage-type endonuclease